MANESKIEARIIDRFLERLGQNDSLPPSLIERLKGLRRNDELTHLEQIKRAIREASGHDV